MTPGYAFLLLTTYLLVILFLAIGIEIIFRVFAIAIGAGSAGPATSSQKVVDALQRFFPDALDDLGVAIEAQKAVNQKVQSLQEDLTAALQDERFIQDFEPFTENVIYPAQLFDPAALLAYLESSQTSSPIMGSPWLTYYVQNELRTLDPKRDIESLSDALELIDLAVNRAFMKTTVAWLSENIAALMDMPYPRAIHTFQVQIQPVLGRTAVSESGQRQIDAIVNDLLEYYRVAYSASNEYRILTDLITTANQKKPVGPVKRAFARISRWLRPGTAADQPENAPDTLLNLPVRLFELEIEDAGIEDRLEQKYNLFSLLIAFLLTYLFQIDLGVFLQAVFSGEYAFLTTTLIPETWSFFTWMQSWSGVHFPALTTGILFSGIIAAALSMFWHKQMLRLDLTRKTLGQLAPALQPIIVRTHEDGSDNVVQTLLPTELKDPLKRLAEGEKTDVRGIVSSQIELLSIFYQQALAQSRSSFNWALVAAGVGLLFFLGAISFILWQDNADAAIISVVSGALIEVIAGINFALYGKTSSQLADFQNRLGTTQRHLLADSVIEGIDDPDVKNQTRAQLVQAIVSFKGFGEVLQNQGQQDNRQVTGSNTRKEPTLTTN